MDGHELLDWAAARKTDPQTSVAAANEIKPKITQRCQQFMEALEKLGSATANEVAQQASPDNIGLFGSIRRRASDLHGWGKITIVARRKCEVTGKPVSVYAIVKD
jgi:hypothetical protein